MTHSRCSPGVQIPIACEAEDIESVSLVVVSFYKFADFPDHAEFRSPLKKLCEELVLDFILSLCFFLHWDWIVCCLVEFGVGTIGGF